MFDTLHQHAMADLEQTGMLSATVDAISQNFRSSVKGLCLFVAWKGVLPRITASFP